MLIKYHDLKKIDNISVNLNETGSIKIVAKKLQKQFGGELSQKHNANFYIDAVIYYERLFLS
ncbi:hypothetical protein D3C71_2168710 [compost metagenome]